MPEQLPSFLLVAFDGSSKPKIKKLDCQFKYAWKNQIFNVNMWGKDQSFSRKALSGRDGDNNTTCIT